MAEHGFATVDERESACRYAMQDKLWLQNTPNGGQWEIDTALAASPTFSAEDPKAEAEGCCTTQMADTPATAHACC